MKMLDQMKVESNEEIAANIYKMVLNGPLAKECSTPGQFIHIKTANQINSLLRRPISIANINHFAETITIIFRKGGAGTTALSEKKPGDVVDVLGPLGNGFPLVGIEKGETALLIGGGIGVPPLYELSKQLSKKGVKVIHVLGFQNKLSSFYVEDFSVLGETYVATVDGTMGTKGFVTEILNNINLSKARVYACGPTPMLKEIEKRYENQEVYLSLEERMGCGIGACFACVRKTVGNAEKGYVKICSDGPVFRSGEVIL